MRFNAAGIRVDVDVHVYTSLLLIATLGQAAYAFIGVDVYQNWIVHIHGSGTIVFYLCSSNLCSNAA